MDYIDVFKEAFKIESTSPNYLVVRIIDLNTLDQKEICWESIDIGYALQLDSTELYLDSLKYTNNRLPIFEIKSPGALKRLRFYQYEIEVVDSLLRYTNSKLIDDILKENNESRYSKTLELNASKFKENYFEHFLFRKGIYTYRDCESGCTHIFNFKKQ
jgi:hypothetical protein